MAVETAKSAQITNRDATPLVQNLVEKEHGPVKNIFAQCTVAVSASSASRYIFCQLPSNARLKEVKLMHTSLGSNTTMDFGFWRTTADGGTAVDQDRIGSLIAVQTPVAESSYSNILSESGDTAFTDLSKPIWELLGLSSDPAIKYDLCGVIMHANGAEVGGTVALSVDYV